MAPYTLLNSSDLLWHEYMTVHYKSVNIINVLDILVMKTMVYLERKGFVYMCACMCFEWIISTHKVCGTVHENGIIG